MGTSIADLPLDGVEVRSSAPTELYANWMAAAFNRRYAGHAHMGGSDAHYLTMVGKAFTWFRGSTAADFRRSGEQKEVGAGGRVNGR